MQRSVSDYTSVLAGGKITVARDLRTVESMAADNGIEYFISISLAIVDCRLSDRVIAPIASKVTREAREQCANDPLAKRVSNLAMQDRKDARLAFHATSVGFYERPCAARKTRISCQRRAYGFMDRLALIVTSPEAVMLVMQEHAAKWLCPFDSLWQLRIDGAAIKLIARTRPSLVLSSDTWGIVWKELRNCYQSYP